MTKPLFDYIFRPMPEIWTDASTNKVLADVLNEYDIVVDDRTQFARLYDYQRGMRIYYRASAGKVTITIWKIDD